MTMRQPLERFFRVLRGTSESGGISISAGGIAYVSFGNEPRAASVRITPEVFRDGTLVAYDEFQKALNELHRAVLPGETHRMLPVTVVLPAGAVYVRTVSVPNVSLSKREETIALNLTMLSPFPPNGAYMSWQPIEEHGDRYELLGAFADRTTIDALHTALRAARFAPTAYEPPSIALARIALRAGKPPQPYTLLVHVSGDGLNLSVITEQGVVFDFTKSWQATQGDAREISGERFESVVMEEVQRVLHFVQGKKGVHITASYIVATGLEETLERLFSRRFPSLVVTTLTSPTIPLAPAWYPASGGALRDEHVRTVNVGPSGVAYATYRDELIRFGLLWRNVCVGTLIFLALFSAGGAYVLNEQARTLEERLDNFREPSGELTILEDRAQEFNRFVALGKRIGASREPWGALFAGVRRAGATYRVSIERIDTVTPQGAIAVTARVPADYALVNGFKNALSATVGIADVSLPLDRITIVDESTLSFTVLFTIAREELALTNYP